MSQVEYKACKELLGRCNEYGTFFINKSPTTALDGKVEEDVWIGNAVDYSCLRVFGCLAYMHISSEEKSMLDA